MRIRAREEAPMGKQVCADKAKNLSQTMSKRSMLSEDCVSRESGPVPEQKSGPQLKIHGTSKLDLRSPLKKAGWHL